MRFITQIATSINIKELEQIVLYPNPTNKNFKINNIDDGTNLCIVDLSGNIIYKKALVINETIIEIENIANGIYVVELESKGVTSIKKLVISKH